MRADISFLTEGDCRSLFSKIESLCAGGGKTSVLLDGRWSRVTTWGNSELRLNHETNDIRLNISREIRGARGSAITNRLDDKGISEAVRVAEKLLHGQGEKWENIDERYIDKPILKPTLWSDQTYKLGADDRTGITTKVMEPAIQHGLLSTGKLDISAECHAIVNSDGMFRYYPVTDVQCSVTVRNKNGTGSGWAGRHDYDLAKIDIGELANRATQKCIRAQDPVTVEPGRYTVVLEPQAVADLFTPVVASPSNNGISENSGFQRYIAEDGKGPFASKRPGYSKIGELVWDRRINLTADPMDPDAGFVPFRRYDGEPYRPVKWVDQGVLRELSYDKIYAIGTMGSSDPLINSLSYRLSVEGITTSIEDMIAATERGILVTRFSNVRKVDSDSVLCTGYTRDGLWLIENGKLSKPVKNFRFTESPIFILNNVDAVGQAERVFSPPFARIAPALKVRDFSFTGLVDSV